ncbi:hypothetical protein [Cerasicoccus frondis]|uniref:hypothetical protein n=1 Tax=Cerasicoccus frondis TaxID=490090 RepID=UPI0028528F0E|nr:hypothetical protein [Cerasicoccus frondis]
MDFYPLIRTSLLAVATVSIALTSTISAATLSGSFSVYDNERVDLTALGDVDWAYWNYTNSNGAFQPASNITNRKNGGTAIQSPTVIGSGNLRGSSSLTEVDISYTDGTNPETASGNNMSGIFSSAIATAGAGISIDIVLPEAGTTYYITLWGSEYATQTSGDTGGIFTASLSGASDYTYDAFYGAPTIPKPSGVYSIVAVADNNNDILTLSYVLPSETNTNGHVIYDALTVSAVPEPAEYALVIGCAALIGLIIQRRRQRN